jgi:hypothetical protein
VKRTFSVFNYQTGRFDYYEAPMGELPAAGFWRPVRGRFAEAAAERLPSGAAKVGDGVEAKGLIASPLGGTDGDALPWGKVAVAGIVVALVGFAFRRKP